MTAARDEPGEGTPKPVTRTEDADARERKRQWEEQNREAIEAWNRWTEENELPLAKYRMF